MRKLGSNAICAWWLACGCTASDALSHGSGSDAGPDAADAPDRSDASGEADPYGARRVPSDDPGAPDMLDLTIPSAALQRDVHVRLLLPPSFDTERARTYPALYLLHGANEPLGYRAWTEQTRVETLVQSTEVLVVMPEAGLAGWYSDWLEACGSTRSDVDEQPGWETFHTVELPSTLARSYRASGLNAVAGLSMGGMGAMAYAARHPDQFAAAASYSGALHTQTNPEVLALTLQLLGCSNAMAVWGDLTSHADVWASHDPYALADRLTEIPLYVSAGNGEPGPLDPEGAPRDGLEALAEVASREFVAQRSAAGGPGELVVRFYGAGRHSWPYWARELERSLPMLLSALHVE
jgi:diacylglycerol O-acyltransferase / trehalose O-mycolyltransferase